MSHWSSLIVTSVTDFLAKNVDFQRKYFGFENVIMFACAYTNSIVMLYTLPRSGAIPHMQLKSCCLKYYSLGLSELLKEHFL